MRQFKYARITGAMQVTIDHLIYRVQRFKDAYDEDPVGVKAEVRMKMLVEAVNSYSYSAIEAEVIANMLTEIQERRDSCDTPTT